MLKGTQRRHHDEKSNEEIKHFLTLSLLYLQKSLKGETYTTENISPEYSVRCTHRIIDDRMENSIKGR